MPFIHRIGGVIVGCYENEQDYAREFRDEGDAEVSAFRNRAAPEKAITVEELLQVAATKGSLPTKEEVIAERERKS